MQRSWREAVYRVGGGDGHDARVEAVFPAGGDDGRNTMGHGGLFVAFSLGWFRPICNTIGRGGGRPRAPRQGEQRERETRNPGQPIPATYPRKKYTIRAPPHPDLHCAISLECAYGKLLYIEYGNGIPNGTSRSNKIHGQMQASCKRTIKQNII